MLEANGHIRVALAVIIDIGFVLGVLGKRRKVTGVGFGLGDGRERSGG
jgi:hypothetical protein